MSRPWMPLYVADYLADTGHLSTIEHGAYLLLIMHYWQKGGLPNNDRQLASIARASLEQWSDIRETLAELFGPEWCHSRIDAEMEKAREKYEKRANAGRAGGKAKANAAKQSSSNAKAMLYQPQPHSSNDEHEVSNDTSSPEPDKSAPVAVIGLPTVSDGDLPIFESDISEWAASFPGVDVRQQLLAMRQWLIANPTRRKTKRGMRKFVVSWLDRRQNAGQPQPSATAPPKRLTQGESLRNMARQAGVIDDTGNPYQRLETSDGNGENPGPGNPLRLAFSRDFGR